VSRVAKEWNAANPDKPLHLDRDVLAKLVDNLNGITASDAERLVQHAIFDHGALASMRSSSSTSPAATRAWKSSPFTRASAASP
jgi:hypothetical protein